MMVMMTMMVIMMTMIMLRKMKIIRTQSFQLNAEKTLPVPLCPQRCRTHVWSGWHPPLPPPPPHHYPTSPPIGPRPRVSTED